MAIKILGTVEQIKGLAKVAGPIRVLDLMHNMFICYPCTKGVYGFIADPGIGLSGAIRKDFFDYHRQHPYEVSNDWPDIDDDLDDDPDLQRELDFYDTTDEIHYNPYTGADDLSDYYEEGEY